MTKTHNIYVYNLVLSFTFLWPHISLTVMIQRRNTLLKSLTCYFIYNKVVPTVVKYCLFIILRNAWVCQT